MKTTAFTDVQEVTIHYKRPGYNSMPTVQSAQKARDIFIQFVSETRIDLKEFFLILLLNTGNKLLGIGQVAIGTQNSALVDIKEVLMLAIKSNSNQIILMHNHPSGNLNFSKSDITLTKRIQKLSRIMGVGVLDHILVTSEGYSSMASEGII